LYQKKAPASQGISKCCDKILLRLEQLKLNSANQLNKIWLVSYSNPNSQIKTKKSSLMPEIIIFYDQ
jgi:hypothetical protein